MERWKRWAMSLHIGQLMMTVVGLAVVAVTGYSMLNMRLTRAVSARWSVAHGDYCCDSALLVWGTPYRLLDSSLATLNPYAHILSGRRPDLAPIYKEELSAAKTRAYDQLVNRYWGAAGAARLTDSYLNVRVDTRRSKADLEVTGSMWNIGVGALGLLLFCMSLFASTAHLWWWLEGRKPAHDVQRGLPPSTDSIPPGQ